MLGFKNFLMEEDGVGVVEMVLIVVVLIRAKRVRVKFLVVLIGIVIIFRDKLKKVVGDIFETIEERSGTV